jgi:hypothetical protein
MGTFASCTGLIELSTRIWTRHSPGRKHSRLNRAGPDGDRDIRRGEVLRVALVYGVEPLP